MTQHTPGPWVDDATRKNYRKRVIRHNGVIVATVQEGRVVESRKALSTGMLPRQADANAAYIVQACNNYPATLEALRDVLRALESHLNEIAKDTGVSIRKICPCHDNEVAKARAVLATIDKGE